MIQSDVGWRDFRLVDHAQYLAVFNPVFRRADDKVPDVAHGVHHEIMYAKCPVYIYQDKKHDPQDNVAKYFVEPRSMGQAPKETYNERYDSPTAIFEAIEKDG